jgi:hypothetical protein
MSYTQHFPSFLHGLLTAGFMASHAAEAHVLFHKKTPSSHVASTSFSVAVEHSGLQRPRLGMESLKEQLPGNAPEADSVSNRACTRQSRFEVVTSDNCGQILSNESSELFTEPDRMVLDPARDCQVNTDESVQALLAPSRR